MSRPRPKISMTPLMQALKTTSYNEVALRCNVHRREVSRWATEGMTSHAADKAAVACDSHPVIIWGEEAWDALHPGRKSQAKDAE